MLVKAGCGGFLGQLLANVGTINSLSSGSIQAGADEDAVAVEANMVKMGWT